MIVIDSSAFLEYYGERGHPEVSRGVRRVIREDNVAVNGVIQVEVCAYASSDQEYESLWHDFYSYHWLGLTRHDFDRASALGRDLRRHGITVPAGDLIIAASAIGAGAPVYHIDSHFDVIAENSELEVVNLRPESPDPA